MNYGYDSEYFFPSEGEDCEDEDCFAECRELLAKHGYGDYDPTELDCDPDTGIIECPVKEHCPLIQELGENHDSSA